MTRIATVENEDYLLNIAEYGTAQHMEILVKAVRTVSRIADTPEDFNAVELNKYKQSVLSETQHELRQQKHQQEDRSVSCYQDDDGMWIIKAKLSPEEGALVAKALQALGDQIAESKTPTIPEETKEAETDLPHNSAKSVSAETFSLDKEDGGDKERLTFPQRRADALVSIAEHYLASDSVELTSLKGAERCQLMMHIRAGSQNTASINASLDGHWLLPSAARRLACDASLLLVQEDEAGNVLDIGRKIRIIPPAMTRALAIRDGGCQFPGCCETRYTEGHHIKHWADGGETKLDNLVTLCRHHHRELHKGAFFLSLKPVRFAERLCFSKVDRYFDSPFSRTEASQNNKGVIAANPAKFTCACCDSSGSSDLRKTLPRLIYNSIDEKTAVTQWAGENMDLEMAVDGLLSVGKRWKHGLN